MAADFRIEINDAALTAGLERLRQALSGGDMSPVFDEIGSSIATSILDRFERQRGPDGEPWTPSLRAEQENGQTLTDSAHLRQSITWNATGDGVEIGTNKVYAAIHQFGGQAGRRHSVTLPPRPFLGLSDDDRDEIAAIIEDHIAETLRGSA